MSIATALPGIHDVRLPSPEAEQSATRQARIMVVEDERIVALDLSRRLTDLGYTVVAIVSSGEEAIEQAVKVGPHLILMDIRLKGQIDGVEAVQRIRARLDTPVIYLTAYADPATLERAKVTEPSGYILKPFEERELRIAIEMALFKRQASQELRVYAAELQRTNWQLSLLNRIVTASADGLEPKAILKITCQELARVVDVPHVTAALLDHTRGTAVVAATYTREGWPPPSRPEYSLAGIPFLHLAARGEPVLLDDTGQDADTVLICDMMRQRGARSVLLLPFAVEEEVIGGLVLESDQPGHFTPETVDLCWSIGEQLASVLARAHLNHERKRLSAAVQQAQESVIITDTEGNIVYVNPAFERTTGYSRKEMIDRNPRILKSGFQDGAFYADMWGTIASGQVWRGRLVNRRQDGQFYTAEATITPVYDGNGTIVNYVSVQRDVTHELQLEEQYRQSLKVEAVGRLSAGIAHDFNNLLTSINGFAELLHSMIPTDDPTREFVEQILGSGERAANLTRQLLAFSRRQVSEPKMLDLNMVVVEVESLLQRTIGEQVELQTILAPDLWWVQVDPTQIERVILNMAINARDAMPDGGTLTLQTANVVLGTQDAYFDWEAQPGEYVVLSIRDTGIGMSDEVKAHLFEPFFTTKGVGKGTGLGLATAYGIVKQSGGCILVDSEEGQGTQFQVFLPHGKGPEPAVECTGARTDVPSGTETILLAEDDPGVRELACRVLQKHGYVVLQARHGEEALQIAEEQGQAADLLLTDVVMPGISGKMLADQLVQRWPGLKVLFMSGYTADTIDHHGVLDPGVVLLPKPFLPEGLLRKVRAVLDDQVC